MNTRLQIARNTPIPGSADADARVKWCYERLTLPALAEDFNPDTPTYILTFLDP